MCCGVEVPFEMAPQHIHQILNGRNGNNMKRHVVVHLCADVCGERKKGGNEGIYLRLMDGMTE